jgi:predicted DNA-binding transcriptional regulator AlpA
MDDPEDHVVTTKFLSDYLHIPQATLYQWRLRGVGPPGIRVGRHLRYRWSSVEAWLAEQANR